MSSRAHFVPVVPPGALDASGRGAVVCGVAPTGLHATRRAFSGEGLSVELRAHLRRGAARALAHEFRFGVDELHVRDRAALAKKTAPPRQIR